MQNPVQSISLQRQLKIRIGITRIHLERSAKLLIELLRHDNLAVELLVNRRREEITARHEVSRPLQQATADNRQHIRQHQSRAVARPGQRDRPGAISVCRNSIFAGESQQGRVLIDSDIAISEDVEVEAERTQTGVAGILQPPGYWVDFDIGHRRPRLLSLHIPDQRPSPNA